MERVGYLLHQRFLKEEMRLGHLKVHSKQSNNRTRFLLPRKYGRDLVVVYKNASGRATMLQRVGESEQKSFDPMASK